MASPRLTIDIDDMKSVGRHLALPAIAGIIVSASEYINSQGGPNQVDMTNLGPYLKIVYTVGLATVLRFIQVFLAGKAKDAIQ